MLYKTRVSSLLDLLAQSSFEMFDILFCLMFDLATLALKGAKEMQILSVMLSVLLHYALKALKNPPRVSQESPKNPKDNPFRSQSPS